MQKNNCDRTFGHLIRSLKQKSAHTHYELPHRINELYNITEAITFKKDWKRERLF